MRANPNPELAICNSLKTAHDAEERDKKGKEKNISENPYGKRY
jgi:hypothetical protein